MKRASLFLIACSFLLSGCTVIRHHERRADQSETRDWVISIGTTRSIKKLKYGNFVLEQLSSDEAKGLESAAEGVVNGITKKGL